MSKVIIRRAEYEDGNLKDTIYEILDKITHNIALSGKNVLIKPNLLSAAPPEKAITTHPVIIREVSKYFIAHGAGVTISDSPAVGSFRKILRECGVIDALKGVPVRFAEFEESRDVKVKEPFNRISLSADALNADIIVNLPKLKTHSQMLLTLGVKNLFGCVVGMRKPRWHLRTGIDKEMFAKLLIEIYRALKPSVTVLDGILALEGQGPGRRGVPKHFGVLLGSKDAAALDFTVARMLRIDPMTVPVNRAAYNAGLLNGVELDGEPCEISNFLLPRMTNLLFGPSRLHGFMRRHLIRRPAVESTKCGMCLHCVAYCPVSAVSAKEGILRFDYDGCIRCYCCVEVCPHGAMYTRQPLLGKIVKRLKK